MGSAAQRHGRCDGSQSEGDPARQTFVYEFVARRPGTFMYHPHADEMTQMAIGMMGSWVTHPREKHPLIEPVDRDFCFLLNSYDIEPGAYTPKIMTMLDFNCGHGTVGYSQVSTVSTCVKATAYGCVSVTSP